jgi:hypothetical protein
VTTTTTKQKLLPGIDALDALFGWGTNSSFLVSSFSSRRNVLFMAEDLIRSVVAACSATQGRRKACQQEMSQLALRCHSVFAVPRKGGKLM